MHGLLKPILLNVSWKKRKKHSLISFPPMALFLHFTCTLSTPLLLALCWVCILRIQSTVFLWLRSVSMSLHLICIRFSTLSGSYLIPTQYAAEGNWVLRPEERKRGFWRPFKFITVFCCGLNGASLAAQGHKVMCYSNCCHCNTGAVLFIALLYSTTC